MPYSLVNFLNDIENLSASIPEIQSFSVGEWEDFLAELRSEVIYPFLFLQIPRGLTSSPNPDNLIQTLNNTLYLSAPHSKGDRQEKVDTLKSLFLIYEKILAYFRNNSYNTQPKYKLDGISMQKAPQTSVDNLFVLQIDFQVIYAPSL